MSAETDHSAYEELLNYFASYLRDIAATISQVKSLAYTLVNVPQPPLKNIQVAPDISSVMNACKRTFDDIKRVESIMRGHTRGKESESSQSASRVQLSSGKKAAILGSKYPNIPLQSEKIGSEKELRTQSATHILENPFRTS
jgi:precorrin-6B methylase 1